MKQMISAVMSSFFKSRNIRKFEKDIDKCTHKFQSVLTQKEQLEAEWSSVTDTYVKRTKDIDVKISNIRKETKSMEKRFTDLKEHVATLEDIVIPGLVKANQTFINSWDAESAKSNFHKAAADYVSVETDN